MNLIRGVPVGVRRQGGCCRCLALCLVTLTLAGAGCGERLRPIFDEQYPDLTWPPAPGEAKIRYVGQLRSTADLNVPPDFFETLGAVFVGAKEPERVYGPRSVLCTHGGDRVWVADPGGRRLHLFDLANRAYQSITTAGDTPLLTPVDVAAGPDNSLYLCDSEAVAVHRFSAGDGAYLETLRLPEDVMRPAALHYDARLNQLWVVDTSAHDVKIMGLDGTLRRIIGRRGEAPGEFNFPSDIAANGDRIWIVDTGNSRVQALSLQGEPLMTLGQVGDAPGDFALPKSIAFDSDGNLYVVDARFENVQIFDGAGRLLLFFGHEGSAPAEFWLPNGIFIDPRDRIWVCDSYNGRLQVFQYVGRAAAAGSIDAAEGSSPARANGL